MSRKRKAVKSNRDRRKVGSECSTQAKKKFARATCKNKMSFKTKADAEYNEWKCGSKKFAPLIAYLCRCGKYHLTKKKIGTNNVIA